jgi:hypothetical protein
MIQPPDFVYLPCNQDANTGDLEKKVPTATCVLRDRYIVSIERVYTPSTFYMKSAVDDAASQIIPPKFGFLILRFFGKHFNWP